MLRVRFLKVQSRRRANTLGVDLTLIEYEQQKCPKKQFSQYYKNNYELL